MKEEQSLSAEEFVKAAIQTFFDGNIYIGFSRPFQLDRPEPDENVARVKPHTTAFNTLLVGNWEECISEVDRNWQQGLYGVGLQFEMELRLPYWYFEK